MTRHDLVRRLAERRGLTLTVAHEVVRCLLAGAEEALREGKRVEIRGFGTLHARVYPSYVGRNPRTGEGVVVDRKVLPIFRPGKALLERIGESEAKEV